MSRLFIISGASGTGKTSVVRELLQADSMLEVSISYTTRELHEGELDGRDYHFVSNEVFARMKENGEFLESAEVHGNCYGTRRQTVLAELEAAKDVLLEIDWQGATQVRDNYPEAVAIFILPPDIDSLRSRLEGRGRDSAEIIARRMHNAMLEIAQAKNYDYTVVNTQLEAAVAGVQRIIVSYRKGVVPDAADNRQHLQQLLAGAGQ